MGAKQKELSKQMKDVDDMNNLKAIRQDIKMIEKLEKGGYAEGGAKQKAAAAAADSRPETAGSAKTGFSITGPGGRVNADMAAAEAAAIYAARRKERAEKQAEAPGKRRGGDNGNAEAIISTVDAMEDCLNNTIGRLAALEA